MELEQVRQAIATAPKGANIVVEWVRPCKVRKGVQDVLTKSVRMVGRMGIDYDNMKAVQEKRASGELPAENQGLNGMEWVEKPYLLRSLKSGRFLIRLYNGTSDKVRPDVHFFQNGTEVTREEIDSMLLASEKNSSHGECFTCHVDDMTRIHTEAEWLMLIVGEVGQESESVPIPAKVLATIQ